MLSSPVAGVSVGTAIQASRESRDKKVHDEFNFTSRMSCVPDFTTQATEESEIQGTKDAYANVNTCI